MIKITQNGEKKVLSFQCVICFEAWETDEWKTFEHAGVSDEFKQITIESRCRNCGTNIEFSKKLYRKNNQ